MAHSYSSTLTNADTHSDLPVVARAAPFTCLKVRTASQQGLLLDLKHQLPLSRPGCREWQLHRDSCILRPIWLSTTSKRTERVGLFYFRQQPLGPSVLCGYNQEPSRGDKVNNPPFSHFLQHSKEGVEAGRDMAISEPHCIQE